MVAPELSIQIIYSEKSVFQACIFYIMSIKEQLMQVQVLH
jgi:hypothetical protein